MKKIIILSAIAFSLTFSANVFAAGGTASSTIGVGGTVAGQCTVNTSPISFTPSTLVDQVTSAPIYVTCASTLPYSVLINGGQHSTPSGFGNSGAPNGYLANSRHLALYGGTAEIPYHLYANAAATTLWADLTGTTGRIGTGGMEIIPLFAKLPMVPVATAPGTYSDSLTVTVNY